MTIDLTKTINESWKYYGNSEHRQVIIDRSKLKYKKQKVASAQTVNKPKTKFTPRRKPLGRRIVNYSICTISLTYSTLLLLEWLIIG